MWEREEVSFNIVGRLGKTGMCCNGTEGHLTKTL